MTFGERLKRLREAQDLTLEEVGEYIGVRRPTVFKYENGIITNIPSDKVEALARLFCVTPAYLMGWTDDQKEHAYMPAPNSEEFRRLVTFMTPDEYSTIIDIYARALKRMIESGVKS